MSSEAEPWPPRSARQEVRAEGGYAYGVIGADAHVFGDGTPVYLLFEHIPVSGLDAQWLRAQPSRMLDARAEVVDFTGRAAEFAELRGWRDGGPRIAVRWLHGEGGQGKTRLAARLAADSRLAGWKVVDAVHGADAHPAAEGGQDLRLDGHAGVLLLVDYADRWPLSDLSWLFHNRLLRHEVPTRVLLIGRSLHAWPAIRGKLNRLRENIDTSDQALAPLPDDGGERDRMFATARDCFARRYLGIDQPEAIAPPGPLSHPDFGLTLAVLMAALVAVDARAQGRRTPTGMVGLTTYLLEREHENWRQLYENAGRGLDYCTPDEVMARTVFTAILTGPTRRPAGQRVLNDLVPEAPAERILADHAVCYPPSDPARANVLEPLLPDRLAEDFLALTLPGSPVGGYPVDPWTGEACTALLAGGREGPAPAWTARAVTFLAAATVRWPHVGDRHLYPLLRATPRLALDAGSAALATLSEAPEADIAALESIEVLFPPRRHVDLDVGMAAVTGRIVAQGLATTSDPVRIAGMYGKLGIRQANAGLLAEARNTAWDAVAVLHRMSELTPDWFEPDLVRNLTSIGAWLSDSGHREQALYMTGHAVSAARRLAQRHPGDYAADLATALSNLGNQLNDTGGGEQAVAATRDAIEIRRRLAASDPAGYQAQLAFSLTNLSMQLTGIGRGRDALAAGEEAVALYLPLSQADPAALRPDLARALHNHGIALARAGRPADAAAATQQAVEIRRTLAAANRTAYQPALAKSLAGLGGQLLGAGRRDDALPVAEEAVEVSRGLARDDPAGYEPVFAAALNNLGAALLAAGRAQLAARAFEEAVTVYQRLAATDFRTHGPRLAAAAANLDRCDATAERHLRAKTEAHRGDRIFNQAVQLTNDGDLAEAERYYAQAADSGHISAMYNLGHLLWAHGRATEAEHWWRRVADSGYLPVLHDLGVLCTRQGRTAEAQQWLRRGAEAGAANAMVNLGALLTGQGRWVEAEHWYRQAARAGESDGDYSLGLLFYQQGDEAGAEKHWRRAIDAGHRDAMFNLGLLCKQQGRYDEAEKWWRCGAVTGDEDAGHNLTVLLAEQGRAADLPPQEPSSRPLAEAARHQGIPVLSVSPGGAVELGALLTQDRIESLIKADRHPEALDALLQEAQSLRALLVVGEEGGTPMSPSMARRVDLRRAQALVTAGLIELGLGRTDSAFTHTAEAAAISRRVADEDPRMRPAHALILIRFASVRASKRTELLRANDAVGEAVQILSPLSGRDADLDVYLGLALGVRTEITALLASTS